METNTILAFFDELRQYNIVDVANHAGVSPATMYSWLDGKTLPRWRTLCKVAPVIGYEPQLVKIRQTLRRVA